MNDFQTKHRLHYQPPVGSGDSSITVQGIAHFPVSPEYRIRIGQELMLVTGVSSTTWSVTRGIEGTTASSHAAGTAVVAVLTAGGLDEMRAEIEAEHLTAGSLASATTTVVVSSATAPTAGQVLTATSGTAADWATQRVRMLPAPAGGSTDDAIAINAFTATKPIDEHWIFMAPSGAAYNIQTPVLLRSNSWMLGAGKQVLDNIAAPPDNSDSVFASGPLTAGIDAGVGLYQDAPAGQGFIYTKIKGSLVAGQKLRIQSGNCLVIRYIPQSGVNPYAVLRQASPGTSVITTTTSGSPVLTDAIRVKFTTGGTIGTSASYEVSLNDGVSYGSIIALGTANTINISVGGGTVTLHLGAGTVLTNELVTILTRVTLDTSLPTLFIASGNTILIVTVPDLTNVYVNGWLFTTGTVGGVQGRFGSMVETESVRWDTNTFDARGHDSDDCIFSFDLGNRHPSFSNNTMIVDDTSLLVGDLFQSEHAEYGLYTGNRLVNLGTRRLYAGFAIWSNYNTLLEQNECSGLFQGIRFDGGYNVVARLNKVYSRPTAIDTATVGIYLAPAGDVAEDFRTALIEENILDCSLCFQTAPGSGFFVNGVKFQDNVVINGAIDLNSSKNVKISGTEFRGDSQLLLEKALGLTINGLVYIAATNTGTEVTNSTFNYNADAATCVNTAIWALAPVIVDGFKNIGTLPPRFFYHNYANGAQSVVKNSIGTLATNYPFFIDAGSTAAKLFLQNITWDQSFISPFMLVWNDGASTSIRARDITCTTALGGNGVFYADAGSMMVKLLGGCDFDVIIAGGHGLTGGGGTVRLSSGSVNTNGSNGTTPALYRFDDILSTDKVSAGWAAGGAAGSLQWYTDSTNATKSLRGVWIYSTNSADTNLIVNVNIG